MKSNVTLSALILAAGLQTFTSVALAEKHKKEAVPAVDSSISIPMVAIPDMNYEIGKFEVTQGEWKAIMSNNPSRFGECGGICPVERVSWNDVQEFLQKLNVKTGKQYRLPSEDEWEFACKGGNESEYCGGSDINAVAWYKENSHEKTTPVGFKKTNGYGLADMSGNVWEWVQDKWDNEHDWHVLRGGSWSSGATYARAANRLSSGPELRYHDAGFRLARTLP